jgi:hypothetical protein
MTDLQLALLALGAVFVAAVVGYNIVQERRARQRAESAFRGGHADALLDPEAGRREPTIGALPADARRDPSLGSLEEVLLPITGGDSPTVPPEAFAAPSGRGAVISSRIDTVALILADEPVARRRLDPLLDALQAHATPVTVEGLVDEQWLPIEDSPRDGWRELRAGLQLASRSGPVTEEEIAAFNETVAGFATSINAVSQRESPAAAAARARELDRFCADTDIEVALNVVGRSGATFSLARVAALALEQGFAETGSGSFERRGPDGHVEITLRRLDAADAKREASYATGLTFALDVPHVANAPAALADMVAIAEEFCRALGGELVDDARRPLTPNGLAAIRRSLEEVFRQMESHGIPAGGPLAHRLFT